MSTTVQLFAIIVVQLFAQLFAIIVVQLFAQLFAIIVVQLFAQLFADWGTDTCSGRGTDT